jgi:hypothetical protein
MGLNSEATITAVKKFYSAAPGRDHQRRAVRLSRRVGSRRLNDGLGSSAPSRRTVDAYEIVSLNTKTHTHTHNRCLNCSETIMR